MSGGHYLTELPIAAAYERIDGILGKGGTVLLDGGVATELQRVHEEDRAEDAKPWGSWALFRGPIEVLEVHRRFVGAGCDLISTNTWSVLEAVDPSAGSWGGPGRDPLWADAARQGVRLARRAIEEAGREDSCAAAFCVNSALLNERAQGRLELLTWIWQDQPPDVVILETLESVPDRVALEAIAMVAGTGLPVWVSFRRRQDGMASADGRVVPDPEPGAFDATLAELERIGVRAVLVNCVPADGMAETVDDLRARTALPAGCYPNLGHSAGEAWEFDPEVAPEGYARLAESWLDAGARIIGGCCGVTPEHVAALRGLVDGVRSSAPTDLG